MLGFVFEIDFGVIDALIGISAFGSYTKPNVVVLFAFFSITGLSKYLLNVCDLL